MITNNITAPVKVGDVVGKIKVYEDGKYMYTEDVTVAFASSSLAEATN